AGDVMHLTHHIDVLGASPDLELAALAARQHGVVSHRQLIEIGLGRGAIERRVAAGRLHRVHRGVYAVGHPAIGGRGRWMAAVLRYAPGAVLSHRDAAALHGLRPNSRRDIDVTALARRRQIAGITLHQVRSLHLDDCAQVDGIPVTSIARTLFDLAEPLRRRDLARVFDEAERLRIFDLRAVEEVCERNRGRRGLPRVSALLADAREPALTRSELERLFLELCRDHGLPAPAMNVMVAGFEVDAWWPGSSLIVELDGFAFHNTRGAFERDRSKDVALKLAGYEV